MGAQSHVRVSFDLPAQTPADVTGVGALRVLEAMRQHREPGARSPRFYQASSSEMFGNPASPQDESTPFHPLSPYPCAKVFAYWQTVNYRDAYEFFRVQRDPVQPRIPRRGNIS
ncbi:MAG: hypothetical protein CM1200mP2_01050 [Planctomycetaceae bacterium]|nr:MAG: hypothetical protein CM1200mP2_01050 [Planctomycetaceae bacterium]